MTQYPLIVTVDQSGDPSTGGVSMRDHLEALGAVERAMRLMVEHLGERPITPGQPPAWVQEQSQLQIIAQQPGSMVSEVLHVPPVDTQLHIEDIGEAAFAAIRDWDGHEDSTLPAPVVDCLHDAARKLRGEARLFLGTREQPNRVCIPKDRTRSSTRAAAEAALLSGWLKEVNWDNGTAQLHDYGGDYVRLRFDDALSEEMLRLATQFVEVRGSGRINDNDEWTSVHVEELLETRSHFEPFDLDAFLNEPNPKLFNPDEVVTVSEPFDVDEFVRSIREARDA